MSDQLDAAGLATALLYVGTALFFWRVGLPQLAAFVANGPTSLRGLQPLRLMSSVVFGSCGWFFLWRAAVWFDLVLADQATLGPIAVRWRTELVIALAAFLAAMYASWLYDRYQRRRRRLGHARRGARP